MITADTVFHTLTSTSADLKSRWNAYINREYNDQDYKTERLDYVDVGEICRFIVEKFKQQDTKNFGRFFENVEMLLVNGDDDIKNLIIVGLLEGIQNISGHENVHYHNGFNHWLKPQTKKAWDDLIFFWESDESKKKWDKINRPKQ